jgi:adenine-specific DNA-methyltransferase
MCAEIREFLTSGIMGSMHTERIIHGDARKALPELAAAGYAGTFRLAYADPPFNTRRGDRGPFADERTDLEWAGLLSAVAQGVLPLLREDGSFWIHVNDRQLGAAQSACDSALGRQRFVGTVVWERTRRASYVPGRALASTTDFLLIYARDPKVLRPFQDGVTQAGKRVPLTHRGNAPTDLAFPAGTVQFNGADGTYPSGDHSSPGIRVELTQPVVVKGGRNTTPLHLRLPSRYSQASVRRLLHEGATFLVPRVPFRPSFLAPGGKAKAAPNLWTWRFDDRVPTNEDAYREQHAAGFARPFPYAKPIGLLKRIVELATDPGDSVLDPFGGSGTTAVAAREAGRGFVLIEEQLATIESFIKPRLL